MPVWIWEKNEKNAFYIPKTSEIEYWNAHGISTYINTILED